MKKEFEYSGLKYIAYSNGDIVGVGRMKKLQQRKNEDGYLVVTLGKHKRQQVKVHTIIAKLFVDGYVDGYEVNHKDFNRENNSSDNLEWVSHKENVRHSCDAGHYGNGKHAGTNNGRAKLCEEDVISIRSIYKENKNISEISRIFGIGWTQTKRIIDNESWKSVEV